MTSILLIICLLLTSGSSWAQTLTFDTPQWDFGTIKEEGGSVSHDFEFENTSTKPLVITNVLTTCGCTTPQYSRKPIGVGERSTIKIEYDPLYRPGVIAREITIHTSASSEPELIKITGMVTPRQRSVEERFPYILGEGVRISSLYSYLQNVEHNNPQQAQLEIINTSDTLQRVEFRNSSSETYLRIESPELIAPSEIATINLSYDVTSEDGFYGELNDIINIFVSGEESKMTLRTRAYAVEDFGATIKKGGANGLFSKKFINFEAFNLKSADPSLEFSIENSGTEMLYIRGVDLPSGVSVVSSNGVDVVGLGVDVAESLTVKVTLIKEELELGAFVKYATFILNDPEEPMVRVKIVGEVSN